MLLDMNDLRSERNSCVCVSGFWERNIKNSSCGRTEYQKSNAPQCKWIRFCYKILNNKIVRDIFMNYSEWLNNQFYALLQVINYHFILFPITRNDVFFAVTIQSNIMGGVNTTISSLVFIRFLRIDSKQISDIIYDGHVQYPKMSSNGEKK